MKSLKVLRKHRELLIILAFIAVVVAVTVFVNLNLPDKKSPSKNITNETPEPEAAVSKDLTLKTYQVEGAGAIKNITFSPDKSKALIVTKDSKLILIDKDGKIIQTIEDKNTLDAKFNTNNQIYYQRKGEDYGIFVYSFPDSKNKDGVKKKLVETVDPDYFKDIAMISEETYFFIQPKTGKYGYGNVSTAKTTILGQKASSEQSIQEINRALFMNPVVTEDKKSILLTERVVKDQNTDLYLRIFASNTKNFDKPQFSLKITVSYKNEYEQNLDGKYFTIGLDSAIINTETKTLIYKGPETQITKIAFSPDLSRAAICSGGIQLKKCRVEKIVNGLISTKDQSSENTLPENITQMEWLNNDDLIFVVGKSLYSYRLSTKALEKVTEAKSENYEIVAGSENNNSILIKSNNSYLILSTNQ